MRVYRGRRTRLLAVRASAVIAVVALSCVAPTNAWAIHNDVVPVPPMGVNPFGYNELANGSDQSACRASNPYPDSGACQIRISPTSIMDQANALTAEIGSTGKSLSDLGYNVIQLDGEWQGPRVDSNMDVSSSGQLIPNPREFNDLAPNGESYTGTITPAWVKAHGWSTAQFGDFLHSIEAMHGPGSSRTLKVGIYSDWGAGINCSAGAGAEAVRDWAYWDPATWGGNGLWGHETTDAATFNGWGVSYVKIDTMCTPEKDVPVGMVPSSRTDEWEAIRQAFAAYDATSSPIAADFYWYGDSSAYSNIFRLGWDHSGGFSAAASAGCCTNVLEDLDRVDAYARRPEGSPFGADNLNDMDNLLVSGTNGIDGSQYLTAEEARTQIGLEALEASPMLIGADINRVLQDQSALDALTNSTMISINQDGADDVAYCVAAESGCPAATSGLTTNPQDHNAWTGGSWELLSKVLVDRGSGWRAIGMLNRSDSPVDLTWNSGSLRKDSGDPSGGLVNIDWIYDAWTSDLPYTGSNCWNETDGTMTCSFTGVRPHGLILMTVHGTSQ